MVGRWRAMAIGFISMGAVLAVASPKASADNEPSSYKPAVHAAAYDDPGVLNYGAADFYGSPTSAHLSAPVVGMASTSDGKGYWLVAADGGVFSYGDAKFYGSAGGVDLNAPIVGMAATPDGGGYWLFALDGGIFSFGDAKFYGSLGGVHLRQPIVGMATTKDGGGYWLVASDGGIFSFGDAKFYGSLGGVHLQQPIVGMAATSDTGGYWLVAADGGIFTFGDAPFLGSLGGQDISGWITGMASDGSAGYWLANANGAIYRFGNATFDGNNLDTSRTEPIQSIVPDPTGNGYWLLEPDAFPTAFTHPGGTSSSIVGIAASQVAGDPDTGYFCNPYGPCEAWCALFATWVWGQAGVGIPSMAFVGAAYDWTGANTESLPATATPSPGDFVYYGTGPSDVDTAVHMGIVAQVWPDGAIDTVEGDAGPADTGALNVIINGPFLPSDSQTYNGFGIFGYGVP